ncbi:MAG TPA: HAD family hydrolase, partial [Candidatus Dormibacteraeota bacterium]|nr:HAD family hydrolase [Candidatus Dormibacteraeota bacterium]
YYDMAQTRRWPMPRTAKAIFFDLGETLVTQNIEDSMVTRNALQEISKFLPRQVSPERLFKLYLAGYKTNDAIRSEYNTEIPIQAWMRQLLSRVTGSEPLDSLVEKCIRIIVKHRAENAVAFDDARRTLRSLTRRRITLGVMSNVSSHEVALRILSRVGLSRYFDLVVTSALTGIRKPDPGIFRYALYGLNIMPCDAVIVGDSERHDIRGGYSAGFTTVLVNRNEPSSESVADYQFRTLGEAAPTLETV